MARELIDRDDLIWAFNEWVKEGIEEGNDVSGLENTCLDSNRGDSYGAVCVDYLTELIERRDNEDISLSLIEDMETDGELEYADESDLPESLYGLIGRFDDFIGGLD